MAHQRADWQRFAMLASVIANVNRSAKSKPFKPDDFMPITGNERQPMDRAQTVEYLRQATERMRQDGSNG